MNLIFCSKDCKYQKDGFCDLHNMRITSCKAKSGCCYYSKKETKNLKKQHKSKT